MTTAKRQTISIKNTSLQSRLGRQTSLKGDLSFGKKLRICGTFNGRIHGGEVLIVDQEAHVEGEINVDTLIAHGCVKGRVNARVSMVIEESGVVHADVATKDIRIALHAQYQGNCTIHEHSTK